MSERSSGPAAHTSSAERVRSEEWRERAPTQRVVILNDLRAARDWTTGEGWYCSFDWVRGRGFFRAGARIWELRHEEFHDIEERICAEHKVAEYRLRYDAAWDREP